MLSGWLKRLLRIVREGKAVLLDGPAARGAGGHTPFYCFAWPFRWSGRDAGR